MTQKKQVKTDNSAPAAELDLADSGADIIGIRYFPLSRIKALSKNFKLHDVSGIARSIAARGLLTPIGVDELTDENFDGNGRVEALEYLKNSDRLGKLRHQRALRSDTTPAEKPAARRPSGHRQRRLDKFGLYLRPARTNRSHFQRTVQPPEPAADHRRDCRRSL